MRIFPAHLLSFRGVGLSVDFEERKLLTVVVVHPFTEVVADVKPSAERSNNESGHMLMLLNLFGRPKQSFIGSQPSVLQGCFFFFFVMFVLPAVGGLCCCLHESCICWIRCAGVYVFSLREAYRAFSQSSRLSFKAKSCQMHQSPAFCALKVCKHG